MWMYTLTLLRMGLRGYCTSSLGDLSELCRIFSAMMSKALWM